MTSAKTELEGFVGAADERDPYVGWNTGRRYNDPDGWIKFRNTELNFEGLVLRLVKDFGYYDASNDEELADFRTFLEMKPPAPGETSPAGVREEWIEVRLIRCCSSTCARTRAS